MGNEEKITYRDIISIIDFLSGRFPVSDEWINENRDDIIADTFEFIIYQKETEKDGRM